ncbi:unnamed protein product [Amaranthus hypochondriacus]
MEEDSLIDTNFQLFSKRSKHLSKQPQQFIETPPQITQISDVQEIEKQTHPTNPSSSFSDLGLSESAIKTCLELKMKHPTPVQQCCIPKILQGSDVLGIAETGSGKTAAFALPILDRLAENPYGVFALIVTPTRELAFQLAEQFRALGSSLHVRCTVIVGGMDMITQSKTLMQRPHIVISTPGRIKVLIEDNPDIPSVFSKTKFLVLDEADRVLDVGFEEELRVIFKCLPKNRQTLLFSATMTNDLTALHELSSKKAYFYGQYEGLKTPDSLKHQYLCVPKKVKDVYLLYILSRKENMGVRSVIVFFNERKKCRRMALLLENLDQEVAELHSQKSQSERLAALHRFKSGKVPILLATGVGERGLDIPTVDLVINYDLPRLPEDYVHRVGRAARAGRTGLAMSLVSGKELKLLHGVEAKLGKEMEEFECKEKDVLADITKVFKARRVAKMKMVDEHFEDELKKRKQQKLKTLAEKGLLSKTNRKRKRNKDI